MDETVIAILYLALYGVGIEMAWRHTQWYWGLIGVSIIMVLQLVAHIHASVHGGAIMDSVLPQNMFEEEKAKLKRNYRIWAISFIVGASLLLLPYISIVGVVLLCIALYLSSRTGYQEWGL